MGRFQIPSTPPTINKTIRFPSDVVEEVEKAIQSKNCTFSAFVIAAVRMALEDVHEADMSCPDQHPQCFDVPRRSKLYIACSDFFQKSERTHAAAPPLQTTPAALGFDLVLGTNLKTLSCILLGYSAWPQSSLCCHVFFIIDTNPHCSTPPFKIDSVLLPVFG